MQDTLAPTCPGCHFGCRLDAYQCARGFKFFEQWQAGEEIPERRMPGPGGPGARKGGGGPGAHGGKPPAGARRPSQDEMLARLVGFLGKLLQDVEPADDAARVAEAVTMHEGFAARSIIGERTRLAGDALEQAVHKTLAHGLATEQVGSNGTAFLHVTDAGKEQAQQAREQRRQAYEEFFAPLGAEQKDAFAESVRTLLDAQRKNARRN